MRNVFWLNEKEKDEFISYAVFQSIMKFSSDLLNDRYIDIKDFEAFFKRNYFFKLKEKILSFLKSDEIIISKELNIFFSEVILNYKKNSIKG